MSRNLADTPFPLKTKSIYLFTSIVPLLQRFLRIAQKNNVWNNQQKKPLHKYKTRSDHYNYKLKAAR